MLESELFVRLKDDIQLALAGGDYDTALAKAAAALAEARATGDEEAVDLALCNRSSVRISEGHYDPAEELTSLRPIVNSAHPIIGFSAAYSMAAVYKDQQELKKAIYYARIARQRSLAIDDHPGRGHAYNQLGQLCLYDSRIPDAIEAFEEARSIFEGSDPRPELPLSILYGVLGYCHILEERFDEGFELEYRCLDMLGDLGNEAYSVWPHLELCFGHLETDRPEKAREHGEQALTLARRYRVDAAHKNALYLLGETFRVLGDNERADTYFDQLSSLYPDIRYLRDFLSAVSFRQMINLRL